MRVETGRHRCRSWARWALVPAALVTASVGSSCNLDPVHRAGVNNLGPEQPDLYPPESEFHRPGEPCVLCHGKSGPADDEFVLAGTIFWGPDDYGRRVDHAYVRIKDATKTTKCFVTNCNGNFYVRPGDFRGLTFPLLVSVERAKNPGGNTPDAEETLRIRRMTGHIGREASCATCHIQGLRDFASPGQIRLFDSEEEVQQANVPITDPCPDPEQFRVTECPEDRL
jgi:hypothetical protein